ERGLILVNDYGPTQPTREEEFEHQRFSLATFVGVNFPLLRAYFGDAGRCRWQEPAGGDEERGIHSRLLTREGATQARLKFEELFGKAALERRQQPWDKARECARVGRFELAATFYREALGLQPYNWVLLNEVALFLIFSLRDVKAGVDLARVAL